MTPPMMPLPSGAAPTQTQFTLAQMPATAPSLTRQVSAAVGAGSLQRVPALTSAGAFAPGGVMQHDSTPEVQRLAAESLAEKLGLASPRRNDEKRARALLDEVTQYVGKYGVDSLRWDDSRLDTQLQRSREARWLQAAKSELLHRAEAHSLVDVIALYYRELLDFAAPHRR